MNKAICYVAGKSGGHIIPAMTLAQQYRALNVSAPIIMFTTDSAVDMQVMRAYPDVIHIALPLAHIPRKLLQFPGFAIRAIQSFWIILKTLRTYRPTQIISTGGYISIPVCLAAKMLGIPYDLYELNAVPGKAIKFLARLARTVYICFKDTSRYFARAATFTTYPVRFTEKDIIAREEALAQLSLTPAPNQRTLFVAGGSQGSHALNEIIKKWALHNKDVCIIHQAGTKDVTDLREFYHVHNITALVFDYRHDMQNCYAATDIVVARAGAGTLFELLFFKKKSIIIPLEITSTSHQLDNAHAIARQEPMLFTVIRQEDIEHDSQLFEDCIQKLFMLQ